LEEIIGVEMKRMPIPTHSQRKWTEGQIRVALDPDYGTNETVAEVCSIDVQDFITALHNQIYQPFTGEFWELVISKSNVNGIYLFHHQRPHLRKWIEDNWFWITERFTPRARNTLRHRLDLLVVKEER
jgi:hypothetical protein